MQLGINRIIFKTVLIFLVGFGLFGGVKSQGICYPFIKRQYFTNTDKVGLSNMSTTSVSGDSKGFWVAGHGSVSGSNHQDGFLMRFNDTGKFVSSLRYGVKGFANANEAINDVVVTPTGGAVVVGSSAVSAINTSLGVVSYFSANGKLKWTKQTPSSSRTGQSDVLMRALVYDANTIVVVGEGRQQTGKSNIIAALLDSTGVTKWSLNLDLNNTEHHAYGIARVGNEWVITGWCRTLQTYPFAAFVRNDGTVRKVWKGTSNGINQFGHVVVAPGGTIYAIGTTGAGLTANVVVCAFTANGNRKWSRSIGTNNVAEGGQHAYFEGSSLWVGSTYQTFTNTRMLLFQIDTATGATIQNQKILSNGNVNFSTVATFSSRNFFARSKGGVVALGVDNAAGVHNNFMINSPCNSTCGTSTSTATNSALTWTWDSTKYTLRSFGDVASLTFDTASYSISQAVNCTQACPLPIKTITSPLVLCPSTSSVSTDATQVLAESYAWKDGSTSPQRSFTAAGTFYLTSKNACGSREDTLIVGSASAPTKPNLKDTLFCKSPFSYSIDVSQPFAKYVWDNGSTLSKRTFTKPGVFWLDTRNACGSRVDSVRFKILLPPVSPKLLDTVFCIGKSVNVTFPKVLQSLYTWPDGDTMVPKSFNGSGTVVLKVSNFCGVAYDTFNVKVKLPPTKSRVRDTTFCSSMFGWDLNMTQPNVAAYLWDDLTVGPKRLITGSGKFYLTLTNACGVRTDTFKIMIDTFPERRLVSEEYFCGGTPYILKGRQFSGYSKYQWNTGAKTGDLSVTQSGTYILHTENACGKRDDTVQVYALRCDCKMWMPSALTPFGSQGLNDEVRPMFVDDWGKPCAVKTGYWSVYNRWGGCVFDKRPIAESWNGIYMDQPVQSGIYVYIVHVIFDETVSGFRNMDKQGTFLVIEGNK